jgi:integrase
VIARAGLEGAGERARPRPHDLRHAFAVRTLIGWHQAGVEIHREMPRLSTYLGHVYPSDTFWYLQAVPELLELAARDLDRLLGGGP